jgi:hypothetical protein
VLYLASEKSIKMLLVEENNFGNEVVELNAESLLNREISDELKIHDLQVRLINGEESLVVAFELPTDNILDFNLLTLSNFKEDDWSYKLKQLSLITKRNQSLGLV